MGKVKFLPQKIELDAPSDKSVMDIALEKDIPIQSSCKGMAICGECRVFILEGENQVLPPTSKELALIGQGHYIDQRRLSCQLFCYGKVTIDLKEQLEKSEAQKFSKTFLKKIKKENVEKMHSIRDNLIEQDEDMKNLNLKK